MEIGLLPELLLLLLPRLLCLPNCFRREFFCARMRRSWTAGCYYMMFLLLLLLGVDNSCDVFQTHARLDAQV